MKSFLLTVVSFLTVLLLLNLGYYRDWFQEKPAKYWEDLQDEENDSSTVDAIRTRRYGVNYTICMKVKEYLDKKKITNPVILFEPNSYYRDSLHIQIRAPEPAVFYYYTGLNGVWTNSPDANKANYLVRISKNGVALDEIRSSEQRQLILARYQKFKPTL